MGWGEVESEMLWMERNPWVMSQRVMPAGEAEGPQVMKAERG